MKNLLSAALLSLVPVFSLHAGTHELPEEKPFVSVSLPDSWETSEIENGIEAHSEDKEVYLAIETTDAENVEAMIDEAVEFLEKEGVTVDEKSMKKTEGKMGDLEAVNVSWSGKDKEGPTQVALSIVVVGEDEAVLFTYWASPEGAKKHDKDIDSIGDSIKKISG